MAEIIVSYEWKCPNCDATFNMTGIQKLQHMNGNYKMGVKNRKFHSIWLRFESILNFQSVKRKYRLRPLKKRINSMNHIVMIAHKTTIQSYSHVHNAKRIYIWHQSKYLSIGKCVNHQPNKCSSLKISIKRT